MPGMMNDELAQLIRLLMSLLAMGHADSLYHEGLTVRAAMPFDSPDGLRENDAATLFLQAQSNAANDPSFSGAYAESIRPIVIALLRLAAACDAEPEYCPLYLRGSKDVPVTRGSSGQQSVVLDLTFAGELFNFQRHGLNIVALILNYNPCRPKDLKLQVVMPRRSATASVLAVGFDRYGELTAYAFTAREPDPEFRFKVLGLHASPLGDCDISEPDPRDNATFGFRDAARYVESQITALPADLYRLAEAAQRVNK